ncbi:hypothetical protein J5N97_024318 [Dioscorea zingiberensis]|uniref:CCHC-type domain-containing protein n=1 Tax=Dioscorea zingiberensis TaxID=325984 RepID=A0A9D5C6H7_9LILI|nr:hypothetical protein J5N97_024318 [Dioscorea zingiberensis]
MPNGYFVICCSSTEMTEAILTDGPWTVNGMILHLIRWREHFQPSFEKLSSAILWVRLYQLPWEYWEKEPLESVAGKIGKVIKVDETTFIQDRAKFARLCIEIDLSQPLKRGVWVNSGRKRCFIPILYERLPVFCYKCGVIGHGADKCGTGKGIVVEETRTGQQTLDLKGKGIVVEEAGTSMRNTDPLEETRETEPDQEKKPVDPNFGTWMTVQWKSNRGRPPAAGKPSSLAKETTKTTVTCPEREPWATENRWDAVAEEGHVEQEVP